MKKAICLLVALLAFTFGISIFYVRSLVVPISLAELRENTEHYRSLRFKVVGKLEVWEAESIYSINLKDWGNDCSEPICFRSLELPEFSGLELSEEVKAENIILIKELAEKIRQSEKRILDEASI